MWHVIPTILYVTYVNGFQYPLAVPAFDDGLKSPFKPQYDVSPTFSAQNPLFSQSGLISQPAYSRNTAQQITNPVQQASYPTQTTYLPQYYPFKPYPRQPKQYFDLSNDDYLRNNNLDQQPAQISSYFAASDEFLIDDYVGNINNNNGGSELSLPDPEAYPQIEQKFSEAPTYFEKLELIDNFANYLKERTKLNMPGDINDFGHQFNALIGALLGLSKVVRNTCVDFNKVYNRFYAPTVETYYNYALANPEKVAAAIEDYIRIGNMNIPKLRKLKSEVCEKQLFCSLAFDRRIRRAPLLYIKELEVIEAISQLARNYYPYIEEFHQAAATRTVLMYLRKSKERLKDFIMHIMNSAAHINDSPVKCS